LKVDDDFHLLDGTIHSLPEKGQNLNAKTQRKLTLCAPKTGKIEDFFLNLSALASLR
jgi:hypothetical protein